MGTNDMIKVMQAFIDGKKIEWSKRDMNDWKPYHTNKPLWNWHEFEYRVKKKKLKFHIYKDNISKEYAFINIDDKEAIEYIEKNAECFTLVNYLTEVEVNE